MDEERLTLVRVIKDGDYARDFKVVGKIINEPQKGEKLVYISNGEKKDTGEIVQKVIKNYKHPKYQYPKRIKIITDCNEYIADNFNKY